MGLFAGSLLVNFIFAGNASFDDLWNIDTLKITGIEILATREYFIYILLKRFKQFGILFALLALTDSMIILWILSGGFAVCLGALLSLETMRMGFRGILLSVCYFFPHYICYLGIMAILMRRISEPDHRKQLSVFAQCSILLLLLLAGCLLEAYMNPIFLKIT